MILFSYSPSYHQSSGIKPLIQNRFCFLLFSRIKISNDRKRFQMIIQKKVCVVVVWLLRVVWILRVFYQKKKKKKKKKKEKSRRDYCQSRWKKFRPHHWFFPSERLQKFHQLFVDGPIRFSREASCKMICDFMNNLPRDGPDPTSCRFCLRSPLGAVEARQTKRETSRIILTDILWWWTLYKHRGKTGPSTLFYLV